MSFKSNRVYEDKYLKKPGVFNIIAKKNHEIEHKDFFYNYTGNLIKTIIYDETDQPIKQEIIEYSKKHTNPNLAVELLRISISSNEFDAILSKKPN